MFLIDYINFSIKRENTEEEEKNAKGQGIALQFAGSRRRPPYLAIPSSKSKSVKTFLSPIKCKSQWGVSLRLICIIHIIPSFCTHNRKPLDHHKSRSDIYSVNISLPRVILKTCKHIYVILKSFSSKTKF